MEQDQAEISVARAIISGGSQQDVGNGIRRWMVADQQNPAYRLACLAFFRLRIAFLMSHSPVAAVQSLWIVLAALLFSVMGVCVKYAAEYMTTLELVFYRSLFGCLFVVALAGFRIKTLRTSNFAVHCSRGVFGFFSLLLFFYAIPKISLSSALALLQTSPLFLTLLSFILLRERPRGTLVAALCVSFVGMLFVLQPQQGGSEIDGGIAALLAGLTAGCAYYNIRRLGALQEGGIRTVFYFTLISTLLSALLLFAMEDAGPFSLPKVLWALAIGVTASIGQLTLTRGLHYGKTIVSSALMYTSILFSGLFDYWLWHSVPSTWAWLGVILIIGGSVVALKLTISGKTA